MTLAGPARAETPSDALQSSTPTVTFGIGAGTSRGLDPARDHLSFGVDPGAQAGDHIVLVNLGSAALPITVYTADALNAHDGAIAYEPRATPGREARTWVSIDGRGPSATFDVRARSSLVLPVSVTVPRSATPGDHVVGVMAAVTSTGTSATGQNPTLEQRIALRAFFRVSGALRPRLEVSRLATSYSGTPDPVGRGTTVVSYVVRNTGNVDLGARQSLAVSGLLGSTGSVPGLVQVPLLLPGGSYPVTVTVHGVVPEVRLTAKVTLTPLGAVGAVNPTLPRVSAEGSFWAVPWTLLIIVVVLLGLGIGWWRWREAHPPTARHRPTAGEKVPVTAGSIPEGDA